MFDRPRNGTVNRSLPYFVTNTFTGSQSSSSLIVSSTEEPQRLTVLVPQILELLGDLEQRVRERAVLIGCVFAPGGCGGE